MKLINVLNHSQRERGSLALEQVLFIGAIVAMSIGLYSFYGNMSTYFSNVGFDTPPSNLGSSAGSAGGGTTP